MSFLCPTCAGCVTSSAAYCRHCGKRLIGEQLLPTRASTDPSESQPTGEWGELRQLIWFYGLLLGITVVCGAVLSFHLAPHAWLHAASATGSALLISAFAWNHRHRIRPVLGVPRASAVSCLGLLGGSAFAVFMLEIYFWFAKFLGFRFIHFWPQFEAVGWPQWAGFLLVSVAPGIFEEIAFRGLIYEGLKRVMRQRDALLVQAMAFSVLHLTPVAFVSHFVMGLGLGILRDRTRSLYVSMVAHAAWNAWVLWKEWNWTDSVLR